MTTRVLSAADLSTEDPIPWDGPLPRHMAIIMDGNGRWAQARGLPRVEGHRRGADTVRTIVRTCRRLGLDALTLYAFSAQNWLRPPSEVAVLMKLLHEYAVSERAEIMDHGIRFNCFGDLTRLPSFVRTAIDELMAASAHHTGMVLSLALSYGGREDIVHAARVLAQRVARGELDPSAIDASRLARALWTRDLPGDVDLVIRTSGEQRVSNFLLWQIAYAELWFTDVQWPAFGVEHLFAALRDYDQRHRRFGALSPGGASDVANIAAMKPAASDGERRG